MTVATQQGTQVGGARADEPTGKAQEVAAQAKEQVQDKANEVKERASQQIRSQLTTRSNELGEQAGSLAQALRRAGEQLERDGNSGVANAANRAGDEVQRLAHYLTRTDADTFLADLEGISRRQPWLAGVAGAAGGFVAARFLKASAETRYAGTRSTTTDADLPMRRELAETATPARRGRL